MADNLTGKRKKQMDPKKRVILIVVSTVAIILVVVFLFKAWRQSTLEQGGSSLSGTPLVESVQGGEISPEYMRALQKSNSYTAQHAQDTGLSAVGTIINTGKEPDNCRPCCGDCGDESLAQALAKLVSDGKISPAVEKLLTNLADQNVSIEEFASKLQDLVKDGTLTPEDARALLEAYKELYKLMAEQQGAKQLNPLIQNGSLPLDAADVLLQMQAQQVPVSEYAAQLQKLVRARRISSQVSNALLEQYKKITQARLDREALGQLNALVNSGEVSQDVASTLGALQSTRVPVGSYSDALDRLVNNGQLQRLAADKLLDQYKKRMGISTDNAGFEGDGMMELSAEDLARLKQLQSQNVSVEQFAGSLKSMVSGKRVSSSVAGRILKAYEKEVSAKQAAIKQIKQLGTQGDISNSIAVQLIQLQKQGVSLENYTDTVGEYIKSNTIPLNLQSTLLTSYQAALMAAEAKDELLDKLANKSVVPAEAEQSLRNLQNQNASLDGYAGQLKSLVEQGQISPHTASALLDAYRNKLGQGGGASDLSGRVASVGSSNAFTDTGNSSLNDIQRRAAAQQNSAQQQRASEQQAQLAQAQQAQQAAQQQAYQAQVASMSQRMMAQAQQLLANNWTPTPQTMVMGEASQAGAGAGGDGGAGDSGSETPGKSIIKAGAIMYAVLDTAVNSDYASSPVMATVVAGKFKGAKLLGTITTSDSPNSDRVILEFSTLTMDSWSTGLQVNAYAIDPETARTAIATSVDYHYMVKYGATFAASFMEGLGQAVADSGSSTTTDDGVTTDSTDDYSTSDEVLIALGEVGSALSDSLSNMEDIEPTVKVKAGVGLGILFMNDVVSSEASSWTEASSASNSTASADSASSAGAAGGQARGSLPSS